MNQDIKQQWLEALRSGKYKQGQKFLRTTDDRFCCLGVLCDLYQKSHANSRWEDRVFFTEESDNYSSCYYLPRPVIEWAELNGNTANDLSSSTDIWVEDSESPLGRDYLGCLNDRGKTFEEIATYIEESL